MLVDWPKSRLNTEAENISEKEQQKLSKPSTEISKQNKTKWQTQIQSIKL